MTAPEDPAPAPAPAPAPGHKRPLRAETLRHGVSAPATRLCRDESAHGDGAGEGWRPIIAALANPQTRRVFAQLVVGMNSDELGADLSPSRRRHVLEQLRSAGILRERDGLVEMDDTVFARLLASASRPHRAEGILRFLKADGVIDRYPAHPAERQELLTHVAHTVLDPGEVISEAQLGERLIAFDEDAARLRRHLVDHGLLVRTRSGSEYALAES